jgi:hypothetical protein
MIRPNNPEIDAAALEARIAHEAECLRAEAAAPDAVTRVNINDVEARLDVIATALEGAAAALERARQRNVPRRGVPSSIAAAGPLGALILRCYNTAFAAQRELDAEQNDALVALVHAAGELATAQRALLRELAGRRDDAGSPS